ncbi:MAG: glycosyltransferase [Burkholderiales bacterium]
MSEPVTLSLIVLSYKRFDATTGPCLATLGEVLQNPRAELILVDNGSSDDSAANCAAWAVQHPSAQYLPLPRNLGFAGGMNVGVGIAKGEWVCLVNSDTLFPPGAVEALLAALARVPAKVAMIGPVTNEAGNGQRLPLPDAPLGDAITVGARAMREPTDLFTPSYRTDFFCAAIQRSVWNQLGGLDTKFGLGYFEDFDFSLRLRALGRKQVIAEDVFIAHVGSATFSAMGSAQRKLMRRNRTLLRERHPGARFEHVRQANERALRHLVATALASGWTDGLRERAAWRYAALLWDEAKSPFKRWRWRWHTRDLRRTLDTHGIVPGFPNAARR